MIEWDLLLPPEHFPSSSSLTEEVVAFVLFSSCLLCGLLNGHGSNMFTSSDTLSSSEASLMFASKIWLLCHDFIQNQSQMKWKRNSHPHSNGNAVQGMPAVVSQTWVKILRRWGATGRQLKGWVWPPHSSEPLSSYKSQQEFKSSWKCVLNISLSIQSKRANAWSDAEQVSRHLNI